jgi:hypothetical protein
MFPPPSPTGKAIFPGKLIVLECRRIVNQKPEKRGQPVQGCFESSLFEVEEKKSEGGKREKSFTFLIYSF